MSRDPYAMSEPPASGWEVRRLDDIAAWLVRDRPGGRPWVVAVDGRSASGKTTFARRILARQPRAALVSTDDVAWHHSFFGWVDLLAEHVLAPARAGHAVAFRPPAWDERGRPGSIDVPAGTELVIVEGVGAGRQELAGLLDAIVWVQSDPVAARERGILRDGGDEPAAAFWDEWMAEEGPFLEADRPWSRAVIIVSGTPQLAHDPDAEAQVAPGPLRG